MPKRVLHPDDIVTSYDPGRRAALTRIGGALVGFAALSACASQAELTGIGANTDCDRDIPNDYYPPADPDDTGPKEDLTSIDSDATIPLADPVGKGTGETQKPHPAASGDARLVAVEKPGCDIDQGK
ncbi:MAG: hypothetical protein O7A03_08335 [Alphaproteobacteria bacterium]|nr:hypothetical protein [Alphaproteobacteria bacterium]